VGFGWGVRIVGFISGAGCVVATLTTNVPRALQKEGPCLTVKAVTDIGFTLLTVGSCLVALGKHLPISFVLQFEIIHQTLTALNPGLFIPFFYIVEYARRISTVKHISFYLPAFMNAGGVVGRVLPAMVSDRIGRFNLLVPSALLSGLFCVTLWLGAHSPIRIIMFCILYGFSSGSFISLITPCVAQISEIREIGTRIGLLYTVISIPYVPLISFGLTQNLSCCMFVA
jgi:MFS family permease